MRSNDNEYKYKMAENYFAKKEYAKAQQLFDGLFPYVKGTARFEDMYYKYAYCAYYLKDYMNAENLFKTYLENFPTGPHTEECEYMRAYCFYKQSPKIDLDQTNTSKAMALMQAFLNTHPQSKYAKEAEDIINKCYIKLETKEYKAAQLYYNLGFYKAAAVAFNILMDDYPSSEKGDVYKLEAIKAYYKYAEMSIVEKQPERYKQVVTECEDFESRFPDSKLFSQMQQYKNYSLHHLNAQQHGKNETAIQLK